MIKQDLKKKFLQAFWAQNGVKMTLSGPLGQFSENWLPSLFSKQRHTSMQNFKKIVKLDPEKSCKQIYMQTDRQVYGQQ